MCWNTPGKSCDICKAIFETCEHDTTYTNKKGNKECIFCEKIIKLEQQRVLYKK